MTKSLVFCNLLLCIGYGFYKSIFGCTVIYVFCLHRIEYKCNLQISRKNRYYCLAKGSTLFDLNSEIERRDSYMDVAI